MKNSRFVRLAIIFAFGAWPTLGSRALAESAQVGVAPSQKGIAGLEWGSQQAEIESRSSGNVRRWFAVLEGRYEKASPGWSLLINSEEVAQLTMGGLSRKFKHAVPLTGPVTQVEVTAVGPQGELERTVVEVQVGNWDEITVAPPEGLNSRGAAGLGLAFGASLNSLKDPRIADFSQVAATLKLSYERKFGDSQWDGSASTYFTLLPITEDPDLDFRYIGFNFRVGYALPVLAAPWTLKVSVGGFYTTIFSKNDNAGFRNLTGPQLFPSLRRQISDTDSMGVYVKFSPLSSGGIGLLSIDSRELATGLDWERVLASGQAYGATIDYSSLNVLLKGIAIESSSLTLGAKYKF